MIKSDQGNRVIFDGAITLTRPLYECKCEKPDDTLSFIHRDPLICLSGIESKFNLSGLKLMQDNIKIEITGT